MFCNNCGEELKNYAKFCGKCGSPVGSDKSQNSPKTSDDDPYLKKPSSEPRPKKKTSSKKKILIAMAVIIIGVIIYGVGVPSDPYESHYSNQTIEELSEMAITWNYDDVVRNPDQYEGKVLHLDRFHVLAVKDDIILVSKHLQKINYDMHEAFILYDPDVIFLVGDIIVGSAYFDGNGTGADGAPAPQIRSINLSLSQ